MRFKVKKKRVIILGGGISGLSLRYFLTKYRSHLEVVLLEKKNRLGGVIESQNKGGFFFEKGPRTFKASKSHDLLNLITNLGLTEEIVVSRKRAARRFLWTDHSLHALPKNPVSFLTSRLTRKLLPVFLREWKQSSQEGDETIYQFIVRRLNSYAADVLFDPMVLGIYGGDIRKLSILSCFPSLKELEKNCGSLTRGLLKKKKKTAFLYPQKMKSSSLFTLKKGLETLITKLSDEGEGKIHLGTFAEQVYFNRGKVQVVANGGLLEGDHLFCALSCQGASQLTRMWGQEIQTFFEKIARVSISIVHLGFQENLLKKEGFGYLVPSKEGEVILGTVFDSSAFPDQNCLESETRFSVMMGGAFYPNYHQNDSFQKIEEGLRGVQKHLGIRAEPVWKDVTDYSEAIPQFGVGHQERTASFRELVRQTYPLVTFLGNYLDGVSMNDCVANAREIGTNFRLF